VALATAEAIRDRVYSLIESLTPTSLTADRFKRHRNELGADFDAWAEKNASGSFRRFQVRETGDDEMPLVSDTLIERVRMRLSIRIAYPATHRYGAANAMDRDDIINQDWKLINESVGIYGRANFASACDCTPLGAVKSREAGGPVDYLVVYADYEYQRAASSSYSGTPGVIPPISPSNTGAYGTIVTYTATGSEGTSFTVSLPVAMSNSNYVVIWSPQNISNFPIVNLPTAGRTTTQFPVYTAAQMSAGEQLVFVVYQVAP